ncbi:hypothetical protein BC937DRAFT_87219, partial [Endogone sp. FLAS-F59071]
AAARLLVAARSTTAEEAIARGWAGEVGGGGRRGGGCGRQADIVQGDVRFEVDHVRKPDRATNLEHRSGLSTFGEMPGSLPIDSHITQTASFPTIQPHAQPKGRPSLTLQFFPTKCG